MRKITSRTIPADLPLLHSDALLHRIYAARGVTSCAELDYNLVKLLFYSELKDVQTAVACLTTAIQEQQQVLVVGDFDVDGATGTALAVLALKSFGLKDVAYLVPNRFDFGYGLTPEIVTVAAQQSPQLIITVDNGITNVDGVAAANALGIKVLITDHHVPGNDLPEACAIVNPNQDNDGFLSKNLAGVGVVFYLMIALRTHLKNIGWFAEQNIPMPNMAQFLDLVALGTVADLVHLDHNNRILVAQGIRRIREGNCRKGIKALMAITGRSHEKILTADLGFVVAPRLNAVGRLDDMSLGIECLLTEDNKRARVIAQQLDVLNNERREIEADMQRQAMRLLDTLQLEQELPPGVCIFEETWHQGVLGVLASRLKDKLNRPVVVFTAVNDTELKGSARSVIGVHMRNALNNIAKQNPGLITKFGGHAMAAGLSLARESYELFAQSFAAEVERLMVADLRGVVHTDGELAKEYFNLAAAELLREAGPWGSGFPEPTFFGEFVLVEQRLVGQRHLKLILRPLGVDQEVDAICFNVNLSVWPNFRCTSAKMVYRLGVNEYRGRCSLQLIIQELMGL